MNRPRNRQPRPNRQRQQHNPSAGHRVTPVGGATAAHTPRSEPATPQQAAATVPKASQVVPGIAVFIVLKEHQVTGRETRGIVQEVLTKGDHWRGIKVRTRDGLVGRVQRIAAAGHETSAGTVSQHEGESVEARTDSSRPPLGNSEAGGGFLSRRYADVRDEDHFVSELPTRSLADFMTFPDDGDGQGELTDEAFISDDVQGQHVGSAAALKCPFCDTFEGDEEAVTYHIDQEHLT